MRDNKDTPQAKTGTDPDDAPDLSQTPWREKLEKAEVRVGQQKGRLDFGIVAGHRVFSAYDAFPDVGRTRTLGRQLS